MKKIYLIYFNYLNEDRKTLSIGGIQTYLQNLCQVIVSMGCEPVVYQLAKENFETTYCGYTVYGIQTKRDRFSKEALARIPEGSTVIFGTHELIRPFKGKTVGIQHGITWDTPVHRELSKKMNNVYVFQRARMGYRLLRQLCHVDTLVCVDGNFINWYRTQVAYPAISLISIPNFCKIAEVSPKPTERINIMFARRLFWYRGTKIFTAAALRLLAEYGDRIHITVAGSGDDESYMRNELGKYSNVDFIKYTADESLEIHKDKHIAVVPTVGSEGTSLSLLEAMSAQCATVCTDVGGMTNIVLNGYNGIMVSAGDIDQLYAAMKELIDDAALRNDIAARGYDTAKNGFSLEKWQKRWREILERVVGDTAGIE